jgi:hypothetical protein
MRAFKLVIAIYLLCTRITRQILSQSYELSDKIKIISLVYNSLIGHSGA